MIVPMRDERRGPDSGWPGTHPLAIVLGPAGLVSEQDTPPSARGQQRHGMRAIGQSIQDDRPRDRAPDQGREEQHYDDGVQATHSSIP